LNNEIEEYPRTNAPASALRDYGLHEKIIALDDSLTGGTYPIDKLDAHLQNVPHVAVSVFLFNRQRMLLQKRADTKYHSAGLWANTMCSHPRWNENIETCASRRLNDELGVTTELTGFGCINYHARVGELYENETVHCFVGQLDDTQLIDCINPREVSATAWQTIPDIVSDMQARPESYAEWFKIYLHTHREMIEQVVC